MEKSRAETLTWQAERQQFLCRSDTEDLLLPIRNELLAEE